MSKNPEEKKEEKKGFLSAIKNFFGGKPKEKEVPAVQETRTASVQSKVEEAPAQETSTPPVQLKVEEVPVQETPPELTFKDKQKIAEGLLDKHKKTESQQNLATVTSPQDQKDKGVVYTVDETPGLPVQKILHNGGGIPISIPKGVATESEMEAIVEATKIKHELENSQASHSVISKWLGRFMSSLIGHMFSPEKQKELEEAKQKIEENKDVVDNLEDVQNIVENPDSVKPGLSPEELSYFKKICNTISQWIDKAKNWHISQDKNQEVEVNKDAAKIVEKKEERTSLQKEEVPKL